MDSPTPFFNRLIARLDNLAPSPLKGASHSQAGAGSGSGTNTPGPAGSSTAGTRTRLGPRGGGDFARDSPLSPGTRSYSNSVSGTPVSIITRSASNSVTSTPAGAVDTAAETSIQYSHLYNCVLGGNLAAVKQCFVGPQAGVYDNIDSTFDKGFTVLHRAAINGNADIVRYLITQGANVNAASKQKWTPLYCAVYNCHADVIQVLIDVKANVDQPSSEGWTPLFLACDLSSFAVAEKLVVAGRANVQTKTTQSQWTPLHRASMRGHDAIVKLLCDYGALVNATTIDGIVPLHLASELGYEQIVDYFLNHASIDLKCLDDASNVKGALRRAVQNGHLSIVRQLVEAGASVICSDQPNTVTVNLAPNTGESKFPTLVYLAASKSLLDVIGYLASLGAELNGRPSNPRGGWSPLHSAASKGLLDVVAYLIECKVDIDDHNNEFGNTALHVAAGNNEFRVIEMLVRAGADCNIHNGDGSTAFQVACSNRMFEAIKQFCETIANVEDRRTIVDLPSQSDGTTALFNACLAGDTDLAEYLIAMGGADINRPNLDGWTVLNAAIYSPQVDVVYSLFEMHRKGVISLDVNRGNHTGWSCLHSASYRNLDGILRTLVEFGGTLEPCTCDDGTTPLITACFTGSKEVVEYLVSRGDVNLNATTDKGWSALHSACLHGQTNIAMRLLSHGASLTFAVDIHGFTPLGAACSHGHWDLVYLMLDLHVDDKPTLLKQLDQLSPLTPLYFACIQGRLDDMSYLVQCGSDVNCDFGKFGVPVDGDYSAVELLTGSLPLLHRVCLHFAGQPNEYSDATIINNVVQKLAALDVDLNLRSHCDSMTALHHLVVNKSGSSETSSERAVQLSVLKALLSIDSLDLNVPAADGRSALHLAAVNKAIDVMHLLVQKGGADLGLLDENGARPLDYLLMDVSFPPVKAEELLGAAGEPVIVALSHGYEQLAKWLVTANRVRAENVTEIIRVALARGNIDFVVYVLEWNAWIEYVTGRPWLLNSDVVGHDLTKSDLGDQLPLLRAIQISGPYFIIHAGMRRMASPSIIMELTNNASSRGTSMFLDYLGCSLVSLVLERFDHYESVLVDIFRQEIFQCGSILKVQSSNASKVSEFIAPYLLHSMLEGLTDGQALVIYELLQILFDPRCVDLIAEVLSLLPSDSWIWQTIDLHALQQNNHAGTLSLKHWKLVADKLYLDGKYIIGTCLYCNETCSVVALSAKDTTTAAWRDVTLKLFQDRKDFEREIHHDSYLEHCCLQPLSSIDGLHSGEISVLPHNSYAGRTIRIWSEDEVALDRFQYVIVMEPVKNTLESLVMSCHPNSQSKEGDRVDEVKVDQLLLLHQTRSLAFDVLLLAMELLLSGDRTLMVSSLRCENIILAAAASSPGKLKVMHAKTQVQTADPTSNFNNLHPSPNQINLQSIEVADIIQELSLLDSLSREDQAVLGSLLYIVFTGELLDDSNVNVTSSGSCRELVPRKFSGFSRSHSEDDLELATIENSASLEIKLQKITQPRICDLLQGLLCGEIPSLAQLLLHPCWLGHELSFFSRRANALSKLETPYDLFISAATPNLLIDNWCSHATMMGLLVYVDSYQRSFTGSDDRLAIFCLTANRLIQAKFILLSYDDGSPHKISNVYQLMQWIIARELFRQRYSESLCFLESEASSNTSAEQQFTVELTTIVGQCLGYNGGTGMATTPFQSLSSTSLALTGNQAAIDIFLIGALNIGKPSSVPATSTVNTTVSISTGGSSSQLNQMLTPADSFIDRTVSLETMEADVEEAIEFKPCYNMCVLC